MERKFFPFDGIKLSYLDSETNGPLLLICHANGYSAGCYKFYAEELQSRYRVLLLDFVGHGESETKFQFKDWFYFRDQILSLLSLFPSEETIAIGHSLGGASVLLASKAKGARIKKVIALDPVILGWKITFLSKLLTNPLAKGAIKRRVEFPSIEHVRKMYRRFPAFAKFDERIFSDYLETCFKQKAAGPEITLRCDPKLEARIFSHAHFRVMWDFTRIQKETHVLIPKGSSVCFPKHARLLTKQNPKSSWEEWQGSNHFFPFEEPERTLSWIKTKLVSPS